jgi:hypothetical protein
MIQRSPGISAHQRIDLGHAHYVAARQFSPISSLPSRQKTSAT